MVRMLALGRVTVLRAAQSALGRRRRVFIGRKGERWQGRQQQGEIGTAPSRVGLGTESDRAR
jgi:hypothetical protein